MIRVNLLPIKQKRRRSEGRAQLIVFTLLIVAELLVLGLFHTMESGELTKAKQRVSSRQAEVTAATAQVKDAAKLEQERDQLKQQLSVLAELEAQRSGPVRVLDELQAMMSPPRNEEDRFAQLQRNWNVDWATGRLWLDAMSEDGGTFEMTGKAVNADDVAEFLQRISTGSHFHDVQLDEVKATNDDTVDFRIFGQLNYAGAPRTGQQGS